jgi:hypothetical protein
LKKLAKCLAAGRRILLILKRKTATCKVTEKKTVSETEHELVVRIPLIVRLRPIVVEPQTVFVPFEVKDVRVAVLVGVCATRHPFHCRLKRILCQKSC